MSFSVDKQTLDDLNIFNKKGRDSVFGLFNRTRTRGGAEILEQLFRYPLSDAGAINHRSRVILFFKDSDIAFPFKEEWFDLAEQYLSNADERSKLSHDNSKLNRTFSNLMGTDTEYRQIAKGVTAVTAILHAFRLFTETVRESKEGTPYEEEIKAIESILGDAEIQQLSREAATEKQNYEKTAAYDKVLRFKKKELLQKLLFYAYHLDVYMAVAAVAVARGFVFPKALPAAEHTMKVEGVYHPLLEHAVGNDLLATPNSNVIFLTGANMAGKSTFMKSLGIAIFLAHMGFPVPAKSLAFPVMDGLFSTINLPDNLSMGYSHFYAEVLRVKKVAEQLALSKKLFVIFDELFRGTNVKDAYEATVALTAAFARKRNCIFVISTHIIEAGDELKERCDNIQFTYLPTRMEGSKPVYTYQLEKGITADRHGMIIVNNEGIIDILKNKKTSSQ
jgi:DNA mismatch repair ATPase MutS